MLASSKKVFAGVADKGERKARVEGGNEKLIGVARSGWDRVAHHYDDNDASEEEGTPRQEGRAIFPRAGF